jgi:GNAT superfamily N-acetyltransferase
MSGMLLPEERADVGRAPATSFEADPPIRLACRTDEAELLKLWAAYLRFSRIELTAKVTSATWQRIVSPSNPTRALVADNPEGGLLGFALFISHPWSFDDRPAYLIDDVYVRPEARRRGIGPRLISTVIDLATAEGGGRVYWLAQNSNAVARQMFDRNFGLSDGYVRYAINLPRQHTVPGGRAGFPQEGSDA